MGNWCCLKWINSLYILINSSCGSFAYFSSMEPTFNFIFRFCLEDLISGIFLGFQLICQCPDKIIFISSKTLLIKLPFTLYKLLSLNVAKFRLFAISGLIFLSTFQINDPWRDPLELGNSSVFLVLQLCHFFHQFCFAFSHCHLIFNYKLYYLLRTHVFSCLFFARSITLAEKSTYFSCM